MLLQLHGVVQHPSNDHKGTLNPVDQEMPWSAHDAGRSACAFPTEAQVPRSDAFAEFRAGDTANSVRVAGDVAQSSRDQRCVAYPGSLSELPFGPREYFQNIGFGWA